ncbi:MAG: tryptophan synthase subunit alpha [Anaerolineales bacterium]|jgi:tryptophan synthase alpha chain
MAPEAMEIKHTSEPMNASRGVRHITTAFQSARETRRAALMPYFTLGFPDPQSSVEIVAAIAASGADLIELGVPFSDPLADGPTIQHSTQVALEQGTTPAVCLELVGQIRARGVEQPLLLMGYINPMLAYGLPRFIEHAAAAGADGLIVPDLPPEEAGEIQALCAAAGLALVFLAAPNSSAARLAVVAENSSGFLYLVSLTGVTGARAQLPPDLADFIQRARATTDLPLAVGFGISSPQQAASVGEQADGVIVGSALIRAAAQASQPVVASQQFVQSLRDGLERRNVDG